MGDEGYRLLGDNFRMSFSSPPDEERRALGWQDSRQLIGISRVAEPTLAEVIAALYLAERDLWK